MGLLDKLWDDTIGGPQPEKGVGRLRKLELPASPRSSLDYGDSPRGEPSPHESALNLLERRRSAEFQRRQEEARHVTQSISISKPPFRPARSVSLPSSFAASPRSLGLASPGSRKEERGVFPGSLSAAVEEGRGPSVYDWYNRMD